MTEESIESIEVLKRSLERANKAKLAAETLLEQKSTELYQVNEKLKAQQVQLIHQEKMSSIGQLSASIAHEINNPIGFVHSNLQIFIEYMNTLQIFYNEFLLLKESYNKDNQKDVDKNLSNCISLFNENDIKYVLEDSVNLIKESFEGTSKVKEIITNLKSFIHTDEEMNFKIANLINGIESSLKIANNEIKDGIKIIKEYENIPDIYCLASQLNQVFLNIILNACHAMNHNGMLTIHVYCKEDYIYISFKDTGDGISEKNINNIFDPFFTTKKLDVGTGLGLSISKKIIDKHGGSINVKSILKVGTTFTISLPIKMYQ